jgi:SpoVK/Ycf46/Vps4 family AAA+-type ATPase
MHKEISNMAHFWRKDFQAVPAAQRRAARYVLQIMARCAFLHPRLADDDFLGALWFLALPLVDPTELARLEEVWNRSDGKEGDIEDAPRRRSHARFTVEIGSLPDGVPGARMREDLIQCFRSLPESLLTRLSEVDVGEPTRTEIRLLVSCAGLDRTEAAILDFVEKLDRFAVFRQYLREAQTRNHNEHIECLSAALDVPQPELRRALRASGNLRVLRLVTCQGRHNDMENFLCREDALCDILLREPSNVDELLDCIVQEPPPGECRIEDFPHLDSDASRLREVLGHALRQGARGINALLYGQAGTGKTQFALAVAAAAGLKAVMVRTAGEDGEVLSRAGRLGAFQLAQRMLRDRRDCLIVFDEVEDVFHASQGGLLALLRGLPSTGSDKGWLNRMLEENPLPAIWITNDAESMDPAFVRRFLLPIAFAVPPRPVRRRIAERHLGDQAIPDALIEELAADDELLPSQFGAARRALDLQPGADPSAVVRETISAMRRALLGSPLKRARQPATRFETEFLNLAGGISPGRIADALARNGRGTLCFYGPPGTGKTEFAHVLADALGRELVTRSAAGILSPWVGMTERNLANLFSQLDTERSVLFLDEVDSLLRDRRLARHGWEATQVNELLQQMERFPGIFIAATNLVDNLDTAALRRFDFKLHFRPLLAAQRRSLFARETLGEAAQSKQLPRLVIETLDTLDMLTPGDFANVARQQLLLNERLSPEDYLRRLVTECRWKEASASTA